MNIAAAFPQRRAQARNPGAAGAFLLPELPAAPAYVPARLRTHGPLALVREIVVDGVIDQRLVEFDAENGVVQLQLADFFVFQVFNINSWHRCPLVIWRRNPTGRAASISNLFPDQHDRAGRPRNSASDQQQVLFRIDLHNAQIPDRVALNAHVTGHPSALNDARRVSRRANGARSAEEHRTTDRETASEAVADNEPGEAAPFAHANHVN